MNSFQPYISGIEPFMEQLEVQAAKTSKQDIKKLHNSHEGNSETKR